MAPVEFRCVRWSSRRWAEDRAAVDRAWLDESRAVIAVGRLVAALVFAAWESVRAGRIASRDALGLVTRTLVSGLVVTADEP